MSWFKKEETYYADDGTQFTFKDVKVYLDNLTEEERDEHAEMIEEELQERNTAKYSWLDIFKIGEE